MSRRIGVRAVQNRSTALKSSASLLQVEATNLKEVIDTQVDNTIFKTDDKDVSGISRACCQWLE